MKNTTKPHRGRPKSGENLTRAVRIDQTDHDRLAARAKNESRSVAALLRLAIAAYFSQEKHEVS